MCSVDGCKREVNRDGLCLPHKLKTVNMNAESLRRERNGEDVTGGMGTAAYVRDMYERRRAAGQPDPEPENSKAARFVPKMPLERKKYNKVNNG